MKKRWYTIHIMNIIDLQNILSGINWNEPTWDLFVAAFFVLAVLLYGFSMGKSRLVVNMVAIYIAMAIAQTVPNLSAIGRNLSPENMFTAQAVVFLIAFVGLYYLLSKKSPLARVVRSTRKEKWSHVAAYSVVHVGLILATILSFIPSDQVVPLSIVTKTIFTHEIAHFLWVVAPIIIMIIFPENIRRSSYDD